MHIVRGPRLADNYTILSNELLRDDRLSFKARGVLALLLSYPDGAQINAATLALRSASDGRKGVLSALKELRMMGYMTTVNVRQEGGRFRKESTVFEVPQTTEVPLGDLGENCHMAETTEVPSRNVGERNVGEGHWSISTSLISADLTSLGEVTSELGNPSSSRPALPQPSPEVPPETSAPATQPGVTKSGTSPRAMPRAALRILFVYDPETEHGDRPDEVRFKMSWRGGYDWMKSTGLRPQYHRARKVYTLPCERMPDLFAMAQAERVLVRDMRAAS